jgi:hypothetical protein
MQYFSIKILKYRLCYVKVMIFLQLNAKCLINFNEYRNCQFEKKRSTEHMQSEKLDNWND